MLLFIPKCHDYRILVGFSPNILPTSLFTSYRSHVSTPYLHVYELCHSRLVMWSNDVDLKPSTFIISLKLWMSIKHFFLNIHEVSLMYMFMIFVIQGWECCAILRPISRSPLLQFDRECKQIQMSIFVLFISIFMKLSHLHVCELCHSRLALWSTRAELKPITSKFHETC